MVGGKKRVISMLVMCHDNFIIEYDRSRPGFPNAPVDMEYDNNRDHRDIASHSIALNTTPKYSPTLKSPTRKP